MSTFNFFIAITTIFLEFSPYSSGKFQKQKFTANNQYSKNKYT
jgi:hypothetical protein